MKFLSLLFFIFSSHSYASCKYIDNSAKVEWTAYKTAKKVPVKGRLKKITITPSKGKTIQTIINQSTFEISGKRKSVDSKNAARDGKIAKFFFGNFKNGPTIKGKVLKINEETMEVQITFNGVSQTIPLKYVYQKGLLKAVGNLDFVSQFNAKKSYVELGKACAAKHEGKTGTDAKIELTAKFEGC